MRTPQLRSIAKRFGKNAGINEFLSALPHEYHEQNLVHAYIAESIGDFDSAVKTIEAFLPYVTNWAVCDSMTPRVIADNQKMAAIGASLHGAFRAADADVFLP